MGLGSSVVQRASGRVRKRFFPTTFHCPDPRLVDNPVSNPCPSRCICFTDESVLLDLKHLLMEAKQKIPPVLAALQADNEHYLELGGEEAAGAGGGREGEGCVKQQAQQAQRRECLVTSFGSTACPENSAGQSFCHK